MTAKKLIEGTRYIDVTSQYEYLLSIDSGNTYYGYSLGIYYLNLGMDVNKFAVDYLATSVVGMNLFKNSLLMKLTIITEKHYPKTTRKRRQLRSTQNSKLTYWRILDLRKSI
ncbi:MAG: hypothetical protein HRT72_05290, partial [Flavobacteriales bacterium]|nr:hypothetical protein [Flavobacteriales bacterium]